MNLSFKIIFLVFISIITNSTLVILLSLQQQKNLTQTFEKQFVENTLQLLNDSLIRDIIDNNILRTTNVLHTLKENNELIEFIYVTDIQNNIFAYSFNEGFPKYLLQSRNIETNEVDAQLINKFQTDNGLIFEYKKKLLSSLDAAIYIGVREAFFIEILKKNINALLLGTFLMSFILILFSLYFSKRALYPLKRLTHLLSKETTDEALDFSSIDSSSKEINQLVFSLKTAMNQVIEKEKNLLVTLNSIGDAVIVTDANAKVVRMNPVAQALTEWTQEEALMHEMSEVFKIIDASTREIMPDPSNQVLKSGETIYLHNHTTLITKNKKEYQIADSAAPIFDDKGDISGVIVVFHDVTEQYKLREKSKNSLEQLKRIFKGITTQIMILELDGTIIISNNILKIFSDSTQDTIVGKVLWNLEHIVKESYLHISIQDMLTLAAKGEHTQKDIYHNNLWLSIQMHPVKNEDGDIVQVSLEATDITQRKKAEEKILYQANYDSLTGVPNRSLALAQLSQTVKESNREGFSVAVLFLDLDNFKNINDNLGHDTGDKVLIQTAKRLQEILRDKDTIGRLGGDEFIISLNDITSPLDAQIVCQNIISNFKKPFYIDTLEIIVSVSIGIVIYPTDGKNISELLINSDIAMYDAKNKGRNTYSFFTKEMNEEVSRQLLLESKMYKALQLKEFEVYYQAKVDVATSKTIGFEALLRWNNSELGFISPEEFIPIAEKSSLIIKIGYFVISSVVQQMSLWKEHIDDSFRISINLSPVQFRDSSLVHNIQNTLKEFNVKGTNIDFEITEGALIQQDMKIKQKLEELKLLGATISMDDFGTGYSSLGYIQEYPFDIIKIDKSFIMNMMQSEKDRDLVRAIIAMARSLKLKVVAEGVETKEILTALQEMKCEYAQGYFFSKAIPAKEIF